MIHPNQNMNFLAKQRMKYFTKTFSKKFDLNPDESLPIMYWTLKTYCTKLISKAVSKALNPLVFGARFLKCIWPFWDIIYQALKLIFHQIWNFYHKAHLFFIETILEYKNSKLVLEKIEKINIKANAKAVLKKYNKNADSNKEIFLIPKFRINKETTLILVKILLYFD